MTIGADPAGQKFNVWHSLSIDEVFSRLKSHQEGLTSEEARRRLAIHGPNRPMSPPRKSAFMRFLSQFHNVLIYVLLSSVVLTALLADWLDAGIILGVVVLNAIIGFLQEGKAQKAVEAIQGILTQEAMVVRDGHRFVINAEELVPGDVVFLQSGDKVPADLRLFWTKDLRIDESALTGESVPVEKQVTPVAEDAGIGDRMCLAFSGTLVTFGQGSGVVVATGDATEIGKVSALLARVKPVTTRLTKQLDEFSLWITGAILVLALGTILFGYVVRDYTFTEVFLASVALAVAAVPEGLPAIITVTLAIGVRRMARRNAIIRSLPAVETLGSVTVICSDKTGTLTRNEMTVKTVVTADAVFQVDGVGYDPHGAIIRDGEAVLPADEPVLQELARASLLCNEGAVLQTENGWEVQGDPTDGALVTLAMKSGLDPAVCVREYPRDDTIPFESEHKFMATLHHDHSGNGYLYVKGAPEILIPRCSHLRTASGLSPIVPGFWEDHVALIAAKGQRTLAVAFKQVGGGKGRLSFEDVEGGLTLLGVLGLIDPPREEAIAAIAKCRSAGIQVKMITGDHVITAASIGKELGLRGEGAVGGSFLDKISDEDLQLIVQKTDVFARVSPEHKLRLVKAIQANGNVVAMTGDGVNDAPALKRADVGIAMGRKGTEAAKEAADMVLADDNFASIAHAVEEGRTVYDNIKKTLAFLLPTNGAQAGIIIASIIAGMELPITPLQILWINMVTAVTLGLSLAFDPAEPGVMFRPPRPPKEPILTQFLAWRIVFISTVMVIGTLGIFLWDRAHGETLDMARTTAINTLIFFQVFYLMNARSLKDPVTLLSAFRGNPVIPASIGVILLLQALFTYFPPMQKLFVTASIPATDWARVIIFSSFVFVLVEAEKAVVRFMEKRQAIE